MVDRRLSLCNIVRVFDNEDSGVVRRSGGRSARVRDAVFEATLEELAENGYGGLSIGGVAERSGVHKTSIYRRWAGRDDLLAAVLDAGLSVDADAPDTGSFDEDLAAFCLRIVGVLNSPIGTVVGALAAPDAAAVDAFAETRRGMGARLRGHVASIVDRAASNGTVPPGTAAGPVLDHLVGPLAACLLGPDRELDEQLARRSAAATAVAARAGVFVEGGVSAGGRDSAVDVRRN